jgi:autotransporter-associated beta strand protein
MAYPATAHCVTFPATTPTKALSLLVLPPASIRNAGLLALSGGITGAGINLAVGGVGNTSISGVIGTTTGTLTKDGAGTLTLSGNNTFTGATTINNGTIEIASSGQLAAVPIPVRSPIAAPSFYSGTNNQTLSGVISGTGMLTMNGTAISPSQTTPIPTMAAR